MLRDIWLLLVDSENEIPCISAGFLQLTQARLESEDMCMTYQGTKKRRKGSMNICKTYKTLIYRKVKSITMR